MRQHQRAANIASIGNLNDDVGLRAGGQITCDPLVLADRALECVDAGGIDDVADFRTNQGASFGDRDRRAGIVGDRDVATGQPSEHHALADIGLSDEGDSQRPCAQLQHSVAVRGVFAGDVAGHWWLVARRDVTNAYEADGKRGAAVRRAIY